MKTFQYIFLFLCFSLTLLSSCDGDNEPIDPALLTPTPTTCVEPSYLSVSGFINGNTVRVTWDKTTADAWEVQYGPSGFAPGTGTTVNFTPTSSLISGLVASVTYDFYIRAKCSDADYSDWIGPVRPGTSVQVCVDPSGVTAVRSTTDVTKATVTWLANGSENSWQVQYGPSGFVIGSGSILASSTPNKVLTGLVGTTSYDVYVRSNCAANENSDWVGPVVINAVGVIAGCTAPTGLSAIRSTTTNTTATVTWTAGGTETSWEIQYGATGFTVGSGTSVTSTTTSKTITGLATSAYDFYVRATCSGSQNSTWVGPVNMAAAGTTGSYYLRMKVDGTLVNFSVAAPSTSTTYNGLAFMIVSAAMTSSFSLQVSSPQGLGTYPYSDPDEINVCTYTEIPGMLLFSSSYDDFTNSPGSIIITDLDTVNQTIKGTFTFIGKNDDMTQSRTITQGEFYLPYE